MHPTVGWRGRGEDATTTTTHTHPKKHHILPGIAESKKPSNHLSQLGVCSKDNDKNNKRTTRTSTTTVAHHHHHQDDDDDDEDQEQEEQESILEEAVANYQNHFWVRLVVVVGNHSNLISFVQ